MQIEQTGIDGVPVIWADTGPGTYVGALVFGVGRSDETAATVGITHLVEHLALAPFGQRDFDTNGLVDGIRCLFSAAGSPSEVADHLGDVARSLHALPWDRVALERRILRDEADQAGQSIYGALAWYRFGAVGHGLPGVDEHGLGWLGPERIRPWVDSWFTRDNAVVWLSGPPPDDLRLELPAGRPPPRAGTAAIAGVQWPAVVPWAGPGVATSYLAPRTVESNVAASVLERRARQALRFEQGLVYDIAYDYVPLGADVAQVVLGADCPDDRIVAVRQALLDVMARLASEGPTEAELAAERTGLERGFEEREGRLGYLDVQASELLLGRTLRQPDRHAAERGAVTAAGAREALEAGLRSLLVLANAEPMTASPWHLYPAWSARAVAGREHRPSGFHLPGRAPRDRLIVGDEGVSVRIAGGDLTVRWDDVVACVHRDPDARLLIGADGFQVVVDAKAWRNGSEAVAAVDARVAPEAVACPEHGIGGLDGVGGLGGTPG